MAKLSQLEEKFRKAETYEEQVEAMRDCFHHCDQRTPRPGNHREVVFSGTSKEAVAVGRYLSENYFKYEEVPLVNQTVLFAFTGGHSHARVLVWKIAYLGREIQRRHREESLKERGFEDVGEEQRDLNFAIFDLYRRG